MAEKEKVARKSHTLDHRGDRSSEGDAHGRSPIKKDKKEKVNVQLNEEYAGCNPGCHVVYNNYRKLTRSVCLLLLGLFVTNSLSLSHTHSQQHAHTHTTTISVCSTHCIACARRHHVLRAANDDDDDPSLNSIPNPILLIRL